jgi:endonuclease-8
VPEGDVVWRTAQRLHAALAGGMLIHWDLRWPSLATTDLRGHEVLEVTSAGKHILCRIGSGPRSEVPLTLHSHLRMEGSWYVRRTRVIGTGVATAGGRDGSAIRAVLASVDWTAVGHRLGMIDLVPTADEARLVGHLGPDVLGPAWSAATAATNLRIDPDRPVGEALLDQRVLAGVGTYFMSEALFLRGVTPWTPVADLGEAGVDALVDLVHRLLRAQRDRDVHSTTGDTRSGATGYVHARSGRPCRRCGTAVRVAALGRAPTDRTAFYCPSCQRGPAPTDDGRPQRPLGARAARRIRG